MESGVKPEMDDAGESGEIGVAESKELEGAKPKQPKDRWDKLQALSPLITGIVLAGVGYFLTGSVNQALQKGQLQFDNAKEIKELLSKFEENPQTSTLEEKEKIATALAAFGSYAILPLLNELQASDLTRSAAAEYGLRLIALADPRSACPALGRVLKNRTRGYNWVADRGAIRILGIANCQPVQGVLIDYGRRLNSANTSAQGFQAFQETLAEDPAVTRETVDLLRSELANSLKLLEQGK